MIGLTAYERRIRSNLIELARSADPTDVDSALVTYGDLYDAVPPEQPSDSKPGRGQSWMGPLSKALYHVSTYEHEHGRPLLTALVVHKGDGRPGEGFAKLVRQLRSDAGDDDRAIWETEVFAVLSFWSDGDPTRGQDAALELILRELSAVKSRLRALEKKAP